MPVAITNFSLVSYQGSFAKDELLHLLRRCLTGVSNKELVAFKNKTLQQCLDILLKQSPEPDPVIQETSDGMVVDPYTKPGETWVKAPYGNEYLDTHRRYMLRLWWAGLIINRDFSVTQKMALFWHNHLAIEFDMVRDSRYSYLYVALLQKHSLGNFKELVRAITVNPAMLVYLGGNLNTQSAPNENYARELMELFTLGKGNGVQYTEDDVKVVARVLTGWRDNKEKITSVFDAAVHDSSDKILSAFFNYAVIKGKAGDGGAKEMDEIIEIIFRKKEAARFLCRNLYRWFLYPHIDDEVENKIIEPLAEICISEKFNVVPVLRTLLSSEHFFDKVFRGCMVKNPIDFLIGAALQIETKAYFRSNKFFSIHKSSESWFSLQFFCEDLVMRIGDPPSVAGWPAYYQSPQYYRWWINSSILSIRKNYLEQMSSSQGGLLKNGCYLKFDFPAFVRQLPDSHDTNKLVDECLRLMCAVQPNASVKKQLVQILESNMGTTYYWEKEWQNYLQTPNNEEMISVIESRLRLFFGKIFSLPEYQTM